MHQKEVNAYAMYENEIDKVYENEYAQKGPFLLKSQSKFCSQPLKKVDGWAQSQKIRYVIFLRYFTAQLDSLKGCSLFPYFDAMAVFVATRNSNQCRMHHNKMMRYYTDKQGLILLYGGKHKNFIAKCDLHEDELRKLGKMIETEPANLRKMAKVTKNTKICKEDRGALRNQDKFEYQLPGDQQLYEKQQKDDIVGTAVSYVQAQPIKGSVRSFDTKPKQSNRSNIPSFSSSNFPPSTLPSFSEQEISPNIFPPPVSNHGMMQFCYPNFMTSMFYDAMMSQQSALAANARQEEWADCHHHFMIWINKLSKLVENNQDVFKSQPLPCYQNMLSQSFGNFNQTRSGILPNF